jgi:hypothetical protein
MLDVVPSLRKLPWPPLPSLRPQVLALSVAYPAILRCVWRCTQVRRVSMIGRSVVNSSASLVSMCFKHEQYCDGHKAHHKRFAFTVFVGSSSLFEGRVALGWSRTAAFGASR